MVIPILFCYYFVTFRKKNKQEAFIYKRGVKFGVVLEVPLKKAFQIVNLKGFLHLLNERVTKHINDWNGLARAKFFGCG